MIETIREYYQINDYLATSGQPTPEEFKAIALSGYEVIINLATSRSTNALPNEGVLVTDLNLIYVQIDSRTLGEAKVSRCGSIF
ncbi:MAG: hypothetical protein AAFO95_15485 [Cyanobacteria bacterium J06600_6]